MLQSETFCDNDVPGTDCDDELPSYGARQILSNFTIDYPAKLGVLTYILVWSFASITDFSSSIVNLVTQQDRSSDKQLVRRMDVTPPSQHRLRPHQRGGLRARWRQGYRYGQFNKVKGKRKLGKRRPGHSNPKRKLAKDRQDQTDTRSALRSFLGYFLPPFLALGTLIGLGFHTWAYTWNTGTTYTYNPSVTYSGDNITYVYTDTDFAGCRDTRKSTSGGITSFGIPSN